jgi:hypothetical protein
VTFVSGGHVHVRTPEGLVTERADELQLPAVRRLDGVLVCTAHAWQQEGLESGVVCQEEPARVLVLLSSTQESVWVERAHACLFEVV